ncbi:SPOR domain-containing protein [Kangiella spongicola]|uniref:Sporulation protein n=1 Tax=Kangiella spongicola TaxID=796379 RepID=A0A318D0A1_9GAMM|nr:SPOR domain-containing protein [Kangiella spongicola]PXF62660.1 sporulation protein [Kangiella spongicola]
MDIKLKHRLVGACVILALAVFFLPMILDSEKYRQDIESQIPTDSVLKQGTDGSSEQSSTAQTGSLTINLDEDEPVKAIKKPARNTKDINQNSNNTKANKPETDVEDSNLTKSEAEASDKISEDSAEKPSEPPKIADKAEIPKKTKAQDNSRPTKSVTPKKDDRAESSKQSEDKAPTTTEKVSEDKTKTVKPEKEEVKKPAFEETAWVIQIGSFSNKENATSLVSDLRNKGYRAYQRDAGKYSRVYVGPYPDKSAAESRVEALQGIVGSAVKVLQFDPQGH